MPDSDALRTALAGMVERVNALLAHPTDQALWGDLDGYTDRLAAALAAAPPPPLDVERLSRALEELERRDEFNFMDGYDYPEAASIIAAAYAATTEPAAEGGRG